MKRKNLSVAAVFTVLVLQVYSHEANTNRGPDADALVHHAAGSSFHPYRPFIESILYNPAVYKKQLSRHDVQAIGYRQAGPAHFIVHFRKEELHGDWQSFYNNRQRCDSGRFYRNLPTGEWRTWYPNGQLKTVRNYNAEKYQYIKADLQRNHPKDQRYAITRMAARRPERFFQPQHEGATNAGRPLSMLQKIQHNTSGDSNAYLPPFATCLHHGVFINYKEDGTVKDSGHYVNGLQHGLWKEEVPESNMQALGFYNHGVRQGQWKYYDAAGRLVYTERYKANGKRSDWHYFTK